MPQLQPLSVKQAKVFISGISAPFTSISGGKYTREDIKFNDGVNGMEKSTAGMITIEALTLTKPFDPISDKEIAAFIANQRNAVAGFTVTVNPVNADAQGSPLSGATTITYTGCILLSYTPAKFDRNGNGLAMIEMTVQPNQLPVYG